MIRDTADAVPRAATGGSSAGARGGESVLDIRGLHVRFDTRDGEVHAVRGIECRVERGECLGVVGESGSGKSQTFLAALGLLARNARTEGVVEHDGRNLLTLSQGELDRVRGERLSMIFQNPLTALTPHMTIGDQMRETLEAHRGAARVRGRRAVRERCIEWLERVSLPEPGRRLRQYPHELSGGMRQRVMIAQAMLCEPELLIADEPTTALDVTIQAEILDLMDALRRDTGTAIILVTHDMGVVARLCERVQVMRAGEYVESGPVESIFHAPEKPYTRELLAAVPRIDAPAPTPPERSPDEEAVLVARDVEVRFRQPGPLFGKPVELRAVDGVSLALAAGETLGIVGESGSGKSTLARAILALVPCHAGEIVWLGRSIDALDARALRRARKDLSVVFQDPMASLNPAMTVGDSVAEPLRVAEPTLSGKGRRQRAVETLERVGLDGSFVNRYPHELSGGQNQRVGIARAVITSPRVLVCDESVSALDVSVQSRVLALLEELQEELGLAMLFISHDLSVVRQVSHRVLVMYLGSVVELAPCDTLFDEPRHPYTRELLSAVPLPDPRSERARERLRLKRPTGPPSTPAVRLRFLPSRLAAVDASAHVAAPALAEVAPGHFVAAHDPLEALRLE